MFMDYPFPRFSFVDNIYRSIESHNLLHASPQPSHSTMTSSPTESPCATMSSNQRYEIVLEAPTAVAPKTEDSPLTYLNKSQCYNVVLKDTEGYDGDITSTISIMFHDESHRKVAPNYWKSWLSQQRYSDKARAIDIDPVRCQRIHQIELCHFDRITFRWNGKAGAIVSIRFNCLSTDFSRIKGVKGFPLRLHIKNQQQHQEGQAEGAFCRIKLFRDKGAERKNKDDSRHIEKQLGKLQFRSGESNPLWVAYSEAQPCTVFCPSQACSPPPPPEISTPPQTESSETYRQEEQELHRLQMQPRDQRSTVHCAVSVAPQLPTMIGKRSLQDMASSTDILFPPFSTATSPPSVAGQPHYFPDMVAAAAIEPTLAGSFMPSVGPVVPPCPLVLDMDPTYIPRPQRPRSAKRCLFTRFAQEPYHRAIYLQDLTVDDLKTKMTAKIMPMALDAAARERKRQRLSITEVVRQLTAKEDVMVRVDDEMVKNMLEGQDMQVDSEVHNDGTMTLILRY